MRAETKVYLNDTLDHSISLIEMVETQRDMLTGLIDMHLSLSQARINEIISFLTIVSAIFIPLTFIVGDLGHELRSGVLAMEHAGAGMGLWISDCPRLHGARCRVAGRLFQMEEMAVTRLRARL